METAHQELWKRIREFPLDEPGADLPFSARLARENGWGSDYARRVVEEYRKFMFLAVAAGHPVTPSDDVDQAWHQHMTYTRSYWDAFCGRTLGKRIHHEPTRGGLEEGRKFEDAYERTLESYRRLFGQEPRSDVWPDARVRFGAASQGRRMDVDRYVFFPKGALVAVGLIAALAALGLTALLLRSTLAAAFHRAMDLRGPEFLGFFAAAFGMVLAGGLLFRRMQRTPDDEPTPKELDLHPYEIALLAGGDERAIHASLSALLDRGVLGAVPGEPRLTRLGDAGPDDPPLDRALVQEAVRSLKRGDLKAAARLSLDGLRGRLVDLGLWVPPSRDRLARAVGGIAVVAAVAVGLSKLFVGLGRARPVLFLGLLLIAAAVGGVWLLFRPLGRTRRGDRALERLRHEHQRLVLKPGELGGEQVPTIAGLFGLAALAGTPADVLRSALKTSNATSSWTGCGAGGCGGGGAGCGGGGCGGCGGCAG